MTRSGLKLVLEVRRHAISDPRACVSYLATRDGQKFRLAVGTNAERQRMIRAADMIDALILDRQGAARAARAASDRYHVPRYALAWYYLVRNTRAENHSRDGSKLWHINIHDLDRIEKNGEGDLYSIDDGAGIGLPDGASPGYLVPDRMRRRWHLVTGNTMTRLEPLLAELGAIDMYVHDSAHTEDVMSFEYEAAWGRLGPGGILASDDVNATDSWQKFTSMHSAQIDDSCIFQEMARPSDSEYIRPAVAYCVKRPSAAPAGRTAALRAARSRCPAPRDGGARG